MQLVFNELSADGRYENIFHANEGVKRLISLVCRFEKELGTGLIMPYDFRSLELSHFQNYTFEKLLNSSVLDHESRSTFNRLIDKAPYFCTDSNSENSDEMVIEDDYYYQCNRCFGFGLACETDGYTLSLDCNDEFCRSPIPVEHHLMGEDAEIEIREINIQNIYSEMQIDGVLSNLKKDKLNSIRKGKQLVEYISDELHHLALSKTAVKQIKKMCGMEPYFPEVRRHLNILNQAMKDLSDGRDYDLNQYGLRCSPESESTLNMYSQERTFECQDGVTRLFSYHSKINIDAWRIYYEPDCINKIVHIGTITRHLRTASES